MANLYLLKVSRKSFLFVEMCFFINLSPFLPKGHNVSIAARAVDGQTAGLVTLGDIFGVAYASKYIG